MRNESVERVDARDVRQLDLLDVAVTVAGAEERILANGVEEVVVLPVAPRRGCVCARVDDGSERANRRENSRHRAPAERGVDERERSREKTVRHDRALRARARRANEDQHESRDDLDPHEAAVVRDHSGDQQGEDAESRERARSRAALQKRCRDDAGGAREEHRVRVRRGVLEHRLARKRRHVRSHVNRHACLRACRGNEHLREHPRIAHAKRAMKREEKHGQVSDALHLPERARDIGASSKPSRRSTSTRRRPSSAWRRAPSGERRDRASDSRCERNPSSDEEIDQNESSPETKSALNGSVTFKCARRSAPNV